LPNDPSELRKQYLSLKGNQVIDGIKRFLQFPFTPHAAPEEDYHVLNKKYFDDNHGIFGATDFIYFGAVDTNGTWRIGRSGNNLVFERREAGAYVTKGAFTP